MAYRVPDTDFAADVERIRLRGLGNPRDLADKTMRLALHLSAWEHKQLCELNPDTLGAPDSVLADMYWRDFCESPESKPFRVHSKI